MRKILLFKKGGNVKSYYQVSLLIQNKNSTLSRKELK